MSNPFDNLISTQLKQLHCNAILEMVRGASLSCSLIFSTSKLTLCPNCYYDSMLKKSTNRYKEDGPRPFSGICPYCMGVGVLTDDSSQTLMAAPIYNQKKWCHPPDPVKTPGGSVATLSLPSTYDIIKQAKEIIINSELSQSVKLRYQRVGEPLPCGLGMSCIIETIWQRVEA